MSFPYTNIDVKTYNIVFSQIAMNDCFHGLFNYMACEWFSDVSSIMSEGIHKRMVSALSCLFIVISSAGGQFILVINYMQ